MDIYSSELHESKAYRSIEINFEFEAKETLSIDEQLLNANGSILVTDEGMTICLSEQHELNIDLLITERVDINGIFIVDKDEQPKNEYSPIVLTFDKDRNFTSNKDEHPSNEWSSNNISDVDVITTSERETQPVKANFPMVVIDGGITIRWRFSLSLKHFSLISLLFDNIK